MKDKQLVVNGLLTTYGEVGAGPVLVLLHGWGDSHRTFEAVSSHLSKNYRVLAPDLPGFGQTTAPDAAWDLDDYADFVGSFLKKTGVRQAVAIIGHSNGAAIAIRALAKGSFKADKLVLLAASGIRENKTAKRTGLIVAAKLGKALFAPLPLQLRHKLQKKLYRLAGSDGLIAPQLKESFKKIVRQDIRSNARELKLPTLLIYGGQDTITPRTDGMTYQQLIKGSQLEIIPGSGHFIHHDNLDVVAKKIGDFLG